jgi:hypothetical protein
MLMARQMPSNRSLALLQLVKPTGSLLIYLLTPNGNMSKTIYHEIGFRPSVCANATTTVNGVEIDTLGLNADICLVARTGAASGSPSAQSATFKVQESDTSGSGYTDITGWTTAAITADSTSAKVDCPSAYIKKRYLRIVATVSLTGGSSPALPVFAALLVKSAAGEPVS